jgi:hypothetical protein
MQMPSEAARELSKVPNLSLVRDELPYRLRQQSLLGEFGRIAMQTRDFRNILQRATELCAHGLEANFAKVLEYQPDENRLMVRAGVGWASDTIDIVSLAADIGSPAGYAYQTGATVISNHLEAETRFRTPKLLAEHGVRRAINVLIERGETPKPSLACWRSIARTPASSIRPMPISSPALPDCWAWLSNVSRPTPSSKRRWSTRGR